MRKKKGFALLQTLVVLMIVVLLANFSLSLINYNYLKAETFNSYNDKRTLSIEDERALIGFNKLLPNNLTENVKIDKYQYIKKNDKYYIIKISSNANRYMEVIIKEHNGEKFLVPTYYKTKDIVEDVKYK